MTYQLQPQPHIYTMRKKRLSLQERKKVADKLPISISHGYSLIMDQLPHLTRNQISQAFTIENRYRQDVFDAAIEIIETVENPIDEQRKKIASYE